MVKNGEHQRTHESTRKYMATNKIVFEKESFKLVGCAIAVYNELKYGLHERYYQRAYYNELVKNGFKAKREVPIQLTYDGQSIGKYMLDFLIDDQIIVELKVGNELHPAYLKQVLVYLKTTGYKLAIIILFSPTGVQFKRLVN